MLGVGNHAVVLLNHRDDVLQQHILEARETGKATSAATTTGTTGTGTTLTRTAGALTHALRTLTHTLRALTLRTGTHAREGELHLLSGVGMSRNGVQAIVHHDDERHGLAGCYKVVHDDARLTLGRPSRLVLAHAVLQIEHREAAVGILAIGCRQINVAMAHLLGNRRIVVDLVHRALRHVLHRVEILVGGRNVDATAPTAGTIIVEAARIGNRSPVDVQLIVVEAFVLRSRLTRPHALGVFHQVVFHAANVQLHAVGLGGRNLCAHHAL